MITSFALALALQIGNPNGGRTGQSADEYDRDNRHRAEEQRDKLPPKPVFLKTPTPDDVMAAYPPEALAKKISGTASVYCYITRRGPLSGCHVVSESPTKNGFGDAAMKLSKIFSIAAKADDNTTDLVGVGLTIPMTFTAP